MELLIKLLTVLGLGAVELWLAIPAGFAMGLPPSFTAITAVSGAVLGLLFILIVGERIRNLLLKRVTIENRRNKYIYRICDRYGVAGLGLLSPLFIGAPLGTALGIAMGIPGYRIFVWMSLGIIICSIGLTMATDYGLKGIWSLLSY